MTNGARTTAVEKGFYMPGPLAVMKVLEIANWVAGPSACAIMADMGAEVVRIEHPETGDLVGVHGCRQTARQLRSLYADSRIRSQGSLLHQIGEKSSHGGQPPGNTART